MRDDTFHLHSYTYNYKATALLQDLDLCHQTLSRHGWGLDKTLHSIFHILKQQTSSAKIFSRAVCEWYWRRQAHYNGSSEEI